jgi:hypothetical protein
VSDHCGTPEETGEQLAMFDSHHVDDTKTGNRMTMGFRLDSRKIQAGFEGPANVG